jgi:hypothetical protein
MTGRAAYLSRPLSPLLLSHPFSLPPSQICARLQAGLQSERGDVFSDVSVGVRGAATLREALEAYARPVSLSGRDRYRYLCV